MNVEAIRIDEWGRPVELAPGTTATYNYIVTTDDNDTDIEELLTWYRSDFAAEIGAERNPAPVGDPDDGREYCLTVTIPASHHVQFRDYLDREGWEEELPDGWTRRTEMKEYRVEWQQCPHVHHDRHVLFVEAANEQDARIIARDHVERRFAISWFTIHEAKEVSPLPAGRVKEQEEL